MNSDQDQEPFSSPQTPQQLPLGATKRPNGLPGEVPGSGGQAPGALTRDPDTRHQTPDTSNILSRLKGPFGLDLVKWRVVSTTKDKNRGQVAAYVSQRSYIDRLNNVLGPAGWSREYSITVAQQFERGPNKALSAKVMVTCWLTVHGIGTHCGMSESWADDENALSRADARAFKHAASCFGLGRYLYEIPRPWVELDAKKQPLKTPDLPAWARPGKNLATDEHR